MKFMLQWQQKSFVGDEKCRHFIGRNASKASSYAGRKMAQSGVAPNGDKNFLMYYWIDEEHSQVNIVAVVYGRREQLAQLEYIDME